MNRGTSVYQIDFDNAPEAALDDILAYLEDVFRTPARYDGPNGVPLAGQLAGSGVSADRWRVPYVRVRVTDDDVARAVAEEIASVYTFSIRTGLGVHERWLD